MTNPYLLAVLVLASAAITWAVRLAPRRVTAEPPAIDEPPVGGELCAMAYCGACQREQYSAMHEDGSHTCWTCRTTSAGDQ
ncbi:hypothetical protein [Streptomyces lydicus]|uniref:hypothetical protein n=1 Tax=Streptomyces lydicus TaxID=47763 RepID=UPI0010136BE0|nr:hypothetical protein [Streptomyces lydicus]MCZ1009932.1 hypothetical protein [Streptomyces lydicus]